jgi:glycogen synthase
MAVEPAARVLMTADTVGGVWTYAVELARSLDRCGIAVALAAMGAPVAPHQRAQLSGTRFLALHERPCKLEWMQQPWQDVDSAGEWLLQLERQHAPHLVHLNQFAFGALPFAAPTLVVAHSCVLSWWRAVRGEAAPAEWDEYRDRVACGLSAAGRVAAPTRAMLESLAGNYGHTRAGVVLPNGRSAERFRAAGKQPFVLAAGRVWDAAKNLAALEAIAPQLPWPVHVAGSTSHPDGGGAPPAHVDFLGELPERALAEQMARASVYALPARYEPFGLSVLEAALSGCALVLGDIPSLRETWGTCAVYVPPDDHAALRATLCALMADTPELARLGAAARARGLRFTTSRMTDAYLSAYSKLHPVFTETSGAEVQCA